MGLILKTQTKNQSQKYYLFKSIIAILKEGNIEILKT